MPQEADKSSFADPGAMWKQWQDAWGTYYESSAKMWSNMLDEGKQAAAPGQFVPPDPLTFLQQLYDAASKSWAQAGENTMGREQFMKAASEFLEHYARFFTTLRHMNEEYLKNLQLPTRSDITGIAELVVALEEKVDQIDDSRESEIGTLQERLERVESKIDRLLTSFDKFASREQELPPVQKVPKAARRRTPKEEQHDAAEQPTS
jgi:hypothetical protein